MRISFLFLSVVLLIGSALPAHAASKRELEAKIILLEQRLATLENRMLTGDPAAERLMQRMDALETSQRSMTGEVERLRYEQSTLQEQVQALASQITLIQSANDEMRNRLSAVAPQTSVRQGSSSAPYSNGRSGGVYAGGTAIPRSPNNAELPASGTNNLGTRNMGLGNDISKLARVGQDRMNEGDFSGAQRAFQQYLDLNPDARDRGDVYFWLGETYYAKSGFSSAADAYIASMRAAPKGDYAPEAMVKLAATARALGKKDMACKTLASFPVQYPKAVLAVRKKAQIENLRSGC
ncbi:MAG: tetratricopeptide repeat protein [Robiginitomaculum sp.]|nr:tetratricopeptide repeat protein [Robiginitomaculum sp.]